MSAIERLVREASRLREALEALNASWKRELLDLLKEAFARAGPFSTRDDSEAVREATLLLKEARLAAEAVPERPARERIEKPLRDTLELLEGENGRSVHDSDEYLPPLGDLALKEFEDEWSGSVLHDSLVVTEPPEEAAPPEPTLGGAPADGAPDPGTPAPGRQLNAWLEDDLPLPTGETTRVGFQIGPAVDRALARADFTEPEWDEREHLDLQVMLWVAAARVTPNEHGVRLPRRGASEPCYFELTPLETGRLELRFMIFLKEEGTFLQELQAEVETVARPSLVGMA